MKVIHGFRDGGESIAYGFNWEKGDGHKHVIAVDFHRWQWAVEFGRGAGYDW